MGWALTVEASARKRQGGRSSKSPADGIALGAVVVGRR